MEQPHSPYERPAKQPPSPPSDIHVLACMSPSPADASVLYTAIDIAKTSHGEITALFVETPAYRQQGEAVRKGLQANLILAEELGIRTATTYGVDPAAQIAEYANSATVTHLVLGRGRKGCPSLPWKRSMADRLSILLPHVSFVILSHSDTTGHSLLNRRLGSFQPSLPLASIGKTLLALLLATLGGTALYFLGLSGDSIITVFVLAALLLALWASEWICGVVYSFASALIHNFLFTDPIFSLRVSDPDYPFTFSVMLVTSLTVSSLVRRIKVQAQHASQNAYRTQVLLETNQKLEAVEYGNDILEIGAKQLAKLSNRTVVVYSLLSGDELTTPRLFPANGEAGDAAELLTPEELETVRWVQENGKSAGAYTGAFPKSQCLYLPVRGEQRILAVAGIASGSTELPPFERNLMTAIVDECGIIIEKTRLAHERRVMAEQARQEALRVTLLRTISHDLRTPLTNIAGSAGFLLDQGATLSTERKQGLYSSIYEDALWLTNLVENLLSVTRVESASGQMPVHMYPELLDEIFQEVLAHLDRRQTEHRISVSLSDEFLMARMDARLMVQVLINLMNNALKYTPAGSSIHLSATRQGSWISIQVADDGPGIPDEEKENIFDMFYTSARACGDGRRGMGLGLALCKIIVTAHGGTISLSDNQPHGAVFTLTLPSTEVPSGEMPPAEPQADPSDAASGDAPPKERAQNTSGGATAPD